MPRILCFALPLLLATLLTLHVSPVRAQAAAQTAFSPAPSTATPLAAASATPTAASVAPTPSALEQGISAFHIRRFYVAAAKFTDATSFPGSESPQAYAWLARTDLHLHRVDEADLAAHKA